MPLFRKSEYSQPGFSLPELLISLMILAEIATFTIPKVLASSQNQQKRAVFKEAIATLSGVVNNGTITGNLNKTSNLYSYLSTSMNAVKLCPSNASTEGCWTNMSWLSEETEAGILLHSGVAIAGIRSTAAGFDNIVIDWNGSAGPNTEGDDRLFMALCWDKTDGAYTNYCSRPAQQGYAELGLFAGGSSQTLWAWIFQ